MDVMLIMTSDASCAITDSFGDFATGSFKIFVSLVL